MLPPEEIAEQQQLLATYRRTLAVYMRQQAEIGRAYSPPAIQNGIDETRSNIRRIKAALKTAGVEAAEDPDDDEPPPLPPPPLHPVALPSQGGGFPRWMWLSVVGILAIALAIIGGSWFFSPRSDTSFQEETPTALEEETPSTGITEETPAAGTDVTELEGHLMDTNIALSAVQVEQVREYINDPNTGYKLLAEHALQVVGDHKFRDTIYLDELDTRYTELVGEEHYAEFNEEHLKTAMVRAWNEHYPDKQVESFEEIVEPRT
jgi:hypothetical protein